MKERETQWADFACLPTWVGGPFSQKQDNSLNKQWINLLKMILSGVVFVCLGRRKKSNLRFNWTASLFILFLWTHPVILLRFKTTVYLVIFGVNQIENHAIYIIFCGCENYLSIINILLRNNSLCELDH